MRASGRAVTSRDRTKARELIERVDEKIRLGLFKITPDVGTRWTRGHGPDLTHHRQDDES